MENKMEFDGRMNGTGEMTDFGADAAKRDVTTGKGRPDLISPFALERLGKWCELGAIKYGDRNWEDGMPYSRMTASMTRHVLSWMMGKTDEDHLAAIMWNAMGIMHYQSVSPEWDDMPKYEVSK